LSIFVGIDIGTSSIKILVLNSNLEVESTRSSQVDIEVSSNGLIVFKPEAVLSVIRSEIDRLISIYSSEIYIGLSCHSPSLVLLDNSGNPLESIIWLDDRAKVEVGELKELISEEEMYLRTGLRSSPLFFPPKIMWIRKHRPGLFEKVRWIVQLKDYVFYKLTGQPYTDYSTASETQLYNLLREHYDEYILSILDISEDMLFNPRYSHEHFEYVGSSRVKIALGGVDSVMAALGSGVISEGEASIVAGSSACWDFPVNKPILDLNKGFEEYFHVVPNKYVAEGCLPTAGLASDKVRELMDLVLEDVNESRIRENPSGIIFMPFLHGTRTPDWNSRVKGLLYGLTISTSREDIYKSVFEGIAYWSREIVELIRELGIQIRDVVASGGLTRSKLFNKILASVLKLSVKTLEISDVSAYGAALIAAISSGILHFNNVKEVVRISEIYDPGKYVELYEKLYHEYRVLKNFIMSFN